MILAIDQGTTGTTCLVFDGGVHDATLLDPMVLEPREIRHAEFATLEQVLSLIHI